MRGLFVRSVVPTLALFVLLLHPAFAQNSAAPRLLGVPTPGALAVTANTDLPTPFDSLSDSLAWVQDRDRAHDSEGRRLIVSVRERRFWWMDGPNLLRMGPVAVGKGTRLAYGDREWEFTTPRGVRKVLGKAENPVWIPPDWHYVELARDSGWALVHLRHGSGTRLSDGGRVVVRGQRIVYIRPDGTEEIIPPDEEVIINDTIFVPPHGSANRRIAGELGAFKLELGDGYMLHGTPDRESIGRAATHGCIRLADEDIAFLYQEVPVGTRVFIY